MLRPVRPHLGGRFPRFAPKRRPMCQRHHGAKLGDHIDSKIQEIVRLQLIDSTRDGWSPSCCHVEDFFCSRYTWTAFRTHLPRWAGSRHAFGCLFTSKSWRLRVTGWVFSAAGIAGGNPSAAPSGRSFPGHCSVPRHGERDGRRSGAIEKRWPPMDAFKRVGLVRGSGFLGKQKKLSQPKVDLKKV